jgi:hypothetical protein
MRTEDLQLISTLGRALYANPAQAESRSLETVAAISTLGTVSEEQFLERALGLMLHQAERDGLRSNAGGVSSPFFRLAPKERFILFLLHSGRLSYRKLSALLSITPEDLQTIAWNARTQVASSPEVRSRAPHPTGSSHLKQACPEFDLTRPWTQKLLDDEMGSRELAFLQNHTSVCPECRRALNQTRELYYAVERTIPLEQNAERAEVLGRSLKKAIRRSQLESDQLPHDLTPLEAIGLFFSRRENALWMIALCMALVALTWAKRHLAG